MFSRETAVLTLSSGHMEDSADMIGAVFLNTVNTTYHMTLYVSH